MTTTTKIQEAATWAAEEYERRTIIIAQNKEKYSLCWVCPSTRVNWHEICKEFNMEVVGPIDRIDFQPAFHAEMKKRHLLSVLNGKMKSDEWYNKYKS